MHESESGSEIVSPDKLDQLQKDNSEISFNQEDSRIIKSHNSVQKTSSGFYSPEKSNDLITKPISKTLSANLSENISNISQDLFTKHYINKDTRGYALTQIFKNYKTIIVTDNETKNSKVISFKGIYHYSTSIPTNENLMTEASVSTTKRS